MFIHFVSLTLFSVLSINLVESKPNCQKCLADSSNYIDHYKYLDCKPIANSECPQCVDRFDCSNLPLTAHGLDVKKCYVADKTYNVGESIMFKRKFCKYCNCVDIPLPPPVTANENTNNEEANDEGEDDDEEESVQTEPVVDFNATAILEKRAKDPPPKYNPLPLDTNYEARVTCTVSSMLNNVLANPADSKEYCYYKESECSGNKHCISKEKLEKEHCVYQGKKYAYGEIIHPEEEDRCLKCKCSSSWTNNINQMIKQCERLTCDLEDALLFKGCIPIYENKCCPTNYYCPQEDTTSNRKPETIKPGKCFFHGKNFDIGTKLTTDNPCLDCTCKLPPYHTCVIKDKCEE